MLCHTPCSFLGSTKWTKGQWQIELVGYHARSNLLYLLHWLGEPKVVVRADLRSCCGEMGVGQGPGTPAFSQSRKEKTNKEKSHDSNKNNKAS